MADWSLLPKDLLQLILQKLKSEIYLTRFRSVCTTWRLSIPKPSNLFPLNLPHFPDPAKLSDHSIFEITPFTLPYQQPLYRPLLIRITPTSAKINLQLRLLRYRLIPSYLLSNSSTNDSNNHKLYKHNIFLVKPPTTPNQQTPYRPWLVRICPTSTGKFNLWHPLLFHQHIHFSSLDFNQLSVFDLGQIYIQGSLYPNSSTTIVYSPYDCSVATFQGEHILDIVTQQDPGKLVMIRHGDDSWTTIPNEAILYHDICIFKGRPCVTDEIGRTVMITSDFSVHLMAEPAFCDNHRNGTVYIMVENESELLLVYKYKSDGGGGGDGDGGDDGDNDGGDSDGDGGNGGDGGDDGDNDGGDGGDGGDSDGDGDGDDFDDFDDDGGIRYDDDDKLVRFDVFRLDQKEKKWLKLANLGDTVVFLGQHHSFTASAMDLGLDKGNFVIYCNNNVYYHGESEITVFHLDQQRNSHLSKYPDYLKLFRPPPEWILNRSL